MYSIISSICVSLIKISANNLNTKNMPIGIGTTIAGQAVGGAIGLGIDRIKQEMQINQARRLQEMQIKGNKELAEYNTQLGLKSGKEMWDYTNYENQRKHMERAGLNVGLMYGGSGGGGATTSVASAGGSVSGQSAHVGNESGMGIAAGQQLALQAAQIKLINAQAKQVEADTAKTTGVDTEEAQTRIANLKQTTNNAEIQAQIMNYDKQIRAIETNIASESQEDIIKKINAEADKLRGEANSARVSGQISEDTYRQVVEQANLTTKQMAVEIALKKAQITQTGTQTELTAEQINLAKTTAEKYVAEIKRMQEQTEQGWQELSQEQQKIAIQKTLSEFATSNPAKIAQWTKILTDITGAISDLTPKPQKK